MKVAILLLALVCASLMGSFAYAHANSDHRTRWDKVTNIATGRSTYLEGRLFADPPALVFFVASMSLPVGAYVYHASNDGDSFQNAFLTTGALAGLLVALAMDIGLVLGIFGLEPWFLILSLTVSDVFHFICIRRPRYEQRGLERNFGDEKA